MRHEIQLRTPIEDDAAPIWQLVHDDGGLDINSPYAYLLVCTDHAETSLVAADATGVVGFVAAYRPPNRDDAVFVWQVGVARRARRRGLGRRMLHALIDQPGNRDVRFVTATVTPDNRASMGLFERLARDLRVPFECDERFAADLFPGDDHDPEVEVAVGPFLPKQIASPTSTTDAASPLSEDDKDTTTVTTPLTDHTATAGQAPSLPDDAIERLESEVRSYGRMWPATFERSSGSKIWDDRGNEYLDLFSGAGALNYGHNDADMRDALVDYLAAGNIVHSLDTVTVAKRRFLERFEEVILQPRNLDYKIMFPGPTGTNAVESAMKLARKVTGREGIIGFTNAFHGMTLGSLSVSGNSMKRDGAGVGLTFGMNVPYDGYFGDDVDTISYLDALLADDGSGLEKPAAVIVETVQAEGGLATASPEWLRNLRELCTKHDVLMIVDDIQAGCGRTGTFFSFEVAGIEPDIVTLSKSLSGFGLPFALTLFRRGLDVFEPGEHNGTFRGFNPAMVTATVALDRWSDDNLEAAIEMKAGIVSRALDDLIEGHPEHVLERRGRGLLQGVACADGIAGAVARQAFELGVIVETSGPNDEVLKLLPALTIPSDELATGLDRIAEAFSDVIALRAAAVEVDGAPQPEPVA